MRRLKLKAAVIEILQALDQSVGGTSPFFYMVGAGISCPPVPLAGTIEAHCEEKARKYSKTSPPRSNSAIECYSHWFELAYPHREGRQRYLRSLIEGKIISRANFRLAHLLLDTSDRLLPTPRIVVTTNFDDLLSRALTLFGQGHVICDHPSTLARIDVASREVQIIHVHGSHWFYDCCNLKVELDQRAMESGHSSASMAAVIDEILNAHSPLVIGYSGWEGDVFMSALQRRLNAPLRTNLYWFCHRSVDVDALPDWLTSNPDVRVVTAEGPELSIVESKEKPLSVGDEGRAITAQREQPLDAASVFDELILTFKVPKPGLTSDPVGFFLASLESALIDANPAVAEESASDVYAIRSVIETVKRFKHSYDAEPHQHTAQESALENFRNAIREADYVAAIAIASAIHLGELEPSQLRELASSLQNSTSALDDDHEAEVSSHRLAVAAVDALRSEAMQEDKELEARSLIKMGIALGKLGRLDESIATFDVAAGKFCDSAEPALREFASRALVNKAFALFRMDRTTEALGVCDEIVDRFDAGSEIVFREAVARALYLKGSRLGALGRHEEAIGAYDALLGRVADCEQPSLRRLAATALLGKGNRLGALGRNEEAVAAFDEVVSKFGTAAMHALREEVARALVNKAGRLNALDRTEQAIATCDEIVQRFGDASEPVLCDAVARALITKGVALYESQRTAESVSAYDEVVRRFGDSPDEDLRQATARALISKAIALGTLDRGDEEMASYDEAVRRFSDAQEVDLREQAANALLFKGAALLRLGRRVESIDALNDLIRRFGGESESNIQQIVASARDRKMSLENQA